MKFYSDLTKAPLKERILVIDSQSNIYSGFLFILRNKDAAKAIWKLAYTILSSARK